LFGGLTSLHDALLEAALTRLGFSAKALSRPDNDSMELGKEFGNRGQCNPTYFTVGNLLRYLIRLRDEEGMRPEDIVARYALITVGGCGPCRFGTYITEYRKALRDAGFAGFRVFEAREFGMREGMKSRFDLGFYWSFFKSILAGDVINALGYRIRPYEVVGGSTDAALSKCRGILCQALSEGRSLVAALRRCRRVLKGVEVDRLRVRPKVSIIGEFWAMTTEGEGNYHLQRFLEAEGAECEIQMITTWALYELWEIRFDTRERMMLRRRAGERHDQESERPLTILFAIRLAEALLSLGFRIVAWAAGLKRYRLPDMDQLARVSHDLYANELRGGEGHMEVAKVLNAVTDDKAHMVISVKPFGCMPSSGISDGVQSLVTARFPATIFCPIETCGSGAVSAYSRIQMALFKARARAEEEYAEAVAETGVDPERIAARVSAMSGTALDYPRHRVAGTAANAVYESARRRIRRSP
jgi:predicted nucleotide-binding protein (sugar kinase/HSP70/actin superfamily)